MGRAKVIAGWAVGGLVALGGLGAVLPDSPTPERVAPAHESSQPSVAVTPGPTASPAAPATALPTHGPSHPPTASRRGTALALLATLPVKGRAAKTGYSREQFGPPWSDTDRNGCDTRNDILRRDLTATTFRSGTHDCVVLSGRLADPYTGRVISFAKARASAVQIDHVVSLSNAWQTGAAGWAANKRVAFANDVLNLLAVDGPTNASKGDGDAATWLPPNKAYRCQMVARQTAVKAKFGLWVTPAERDAVARLLSTCRELVAPSGGNPTTAPVRASAPRSTAPAPSSGGGTDPRFGTCKEAKANGYGPYYRGRDAEYDWYRDGDSDGVVCE